MWRPHDACWISCKTEEGIPALLDAIQRQVEDLCTAGGSADVAVCNDRHRIHLEHCIEALARIDDGVADVVYAAEELREAAVNVRVCVGHIVA